MLLSFPSMGTSKILASGFCIITVSAFVGGIFSAGGAADFMYTEDPPKTTLWPVVSMIGFFDSSMGGWIGGLVALTCGML